MVTREQLRLVKEVFLQALDLPSTDRAGFLSTLSDVDPDILDEARSLLATHASVPDWNLPAPSEQLRPILDDRMTPDETPARIGRYRIVRLLGEGGMGAVYEAEQDAPRRRVALKVLRPSLFSSGSGPRFAFEAEALGRLRHPNIASIFEAGIDRSSGRSDPFFAMEYIEHALPITTFADRQSLSPADRVRLLVPVCEAIQHAHQRGVLHRDLKPDNILVDPAGAPKVIDFGVARALDPNGKPTSLGTGSAPIGTPAYSSPEQLDPSIPDVDTRSDVYSLGVVLYELLTGTLPYDVSWARIASALHDIRTSDPRRPSEFNPCLAGDYDAVALKAIAADPDKRYESATEFLEDLRRLGHGEPVAARPPGPLDRLGRWMSRHPAAVVGAACVAVGAAVPVIVASASGWGRIMVLQRQLESQSEELAEQAQQLDALRRDYEAAVSGGFVFNVTENGRSLAVLSMPDRAEVHRWTLSEDRYRHHELHTKLDTPDGWLAAVVAEWMLPSGEVVERLQVFDPADWTTPIWVAPFEFSEFAIPAFEPPADCPRRVEVDAGWDFAVRAIRSADVFPEVPGQELIVAHVHTKDFPTSIRVYAARPDAHGEPVVLFEAWNPGHVACIEPEQNAGTLLLGGANNWLPRPGRPNIPGPAPDSLRMLAAIRPQLGLRMDCWLDESQAEAIVPWMRVIRERAINQRIELTRITPRVGHRLRPGVAGISAVVRGSTEDYPPDISFAFDVQTGHAGLDVIVADGFRRDWSSTADPSERPTTDLFGPMPDAFPFEPIKTAETEGLLGYPALDWR